MMHDTLWQKLLFLFLFFITRIVSAQTPPPLVISTDVFSPPFVSYGGANQLFGFDINMMEYICKTLNRTCQYKPTVFKHILEQVVDQEVDVGLGRVIITLERSKMVAFSIPYLLSYAQYLGGNIWKFKTFHKSDLTGKRIGILKGGIFEGAIIAENIPNIQIKRYKTDPDIIAALSNRDVDFVLMDAVSAQYWQIQTNGLIVTIGKPFLYGYGFGIAVNLQNLKLLEAINAALLQYQNTGGFEKAYNQYLAPL